MATIEVSTWAELAACPSSLSNGDTVSITQDINCNDEIPTGVASTITFQNKNVVIDGNHHTIRNLRTSITNPVEIFASDLGEGKFTLQNIDFINLYIAAPLMDFVGADRGIIKNCRFVGKRTHNLCVNRTSWGSGITLESCFFNVPYLPNKISDFDASKLRLQVCATNKAFARYCRFYEHELIRDSEVTSSPTADCTEFSALQMDGCYISGTIVGWTYVDGSDVTGVLNLGAYSYSSSMQNVIDADIRFKSTVSDDILPSEIQLYCPAGVLKNYYRKYGDDSTVISATIVNNNNATILASPAEMVDPAALYAKGFDIMVPGQ